MRNKRQPRFGLVAGLMAGILALSGCADSSYDCFPVRPDNFFPVKVSVPQHPVNGLSLRPVFACFPAFILFCVDSPLPFLAI